MKCPYCMESLDDSAIVCRVCRRDLAFLLPVLERTRRLEESVAELCRAMEERPAQAGVAAADSPVNLQHLSLTFAFCMSVFIAFLSYSISWQDFAGSRFDQLWKLISSGAPLLAATWLGMSCPGMQVRRFWQVGLLAGFGGWAQNILFYMHRVNRLPGNWSVLLLVYLAAGAFLFVAGGTFGSRFGSKLQHPNRRFSDPTGVTKHSVVSQPVVQAYVQMGLGFVGPLLLAFVHTGSK